MAENRWRKVGVAVVMVGGIATVVDASETLPSIGINMASFTGGRKGPNTGDGDSNSALAADEWGGLPAIRQANFNNVGNVPGPLLGTNSATNLNVDLAGVGTPSTASLTFTGIPLRGGGGAGGGPGFTAASGADPNRFNSELGTVDGGTSPGTPTQRPTNYQLFEAYASTEDNSFHVYDVANLSPSITANGYSVYVYSLMGEPTRGGTYRMNVPFQATPTSVGGTNMDITFDGNNDGTFTLTDDGVIGVTKKRGNAAFDRTEKTTAFVEDPGLFFADDLRTTEVEPTDTGNYMVFTGLTGSSFQLTVSTQGEFNAALGPNQTSDGFAGRDFNGDANFRERAGINFIQIVANPIPEPTTFGLLGLASLAALARRRRA